MRRSMVRTFVGSILTALLAGCGFEESLKVSAEVRPGGTLDIDLVRGDVEIATHDANEVRIEALARGWDVVAFDFELDEDGEDVALKGDLDFWRLAVWLDLDVTVHALVPRDYSVDVRTRRGAVEIGQIRGDVDVSTSHGSVRVADIDGQTSIRSSRAEISVQSVTGDVDVMTSRGGIEITGVEGEVRAHTSRGPIQVSGVGGDVKVRTSRGPIRIEKARGAVEAETSRGPIYVHDVAGAVEARTSRGRIFTSFSQQPRGEIETSRGTIEVLIPATAGVNLDAETSRGRIQVTDGIEVDGDVARERIIARLNGGGDPLRLRTSGDDIRIGTR